MWCRVSGTSVNLAVQTQVDEELMDQIRLMRNKLIDSKTKDKTLMSMLDLIDDVIDTNTVAMSKEACVEICGIGERTYEIDIEKVRTAHPTAAKILVRLSW